MADRKKDYRPPVMYIRDVIFGEPKSLPNKMHEVGISLLVLAGNWPAHGTTYRFVVNGAPVGNDQLVMDGRATAKVVLPQGKSTIAVELKHPQFGARLVSLAEKEMGSEVKKKNEVTKIEIIGETSDDDSLYISLARLDKTGKGKKGKVAFFNPNTGDVEEMNSNDNGVATIQIDLSDKRQTATFYLPEKPGQKIEKEIPAKKKVTAPIQTCATPEPQTKKPLADRMREAYRRGRQG